LRMSYMILPIKLVKQFEMLNLNMIPDFSMINALTLNLMIKEGHYEKYVKKMHHLYEKKREYLIAQLTNVFKNNIKVKDTRAGLHFIVEINTIYSYAAIESRTNETRWALDTLNTLTVAPPENNKTNKTL